MHQHPTPSQIQLVRSNWALVAPSEAQVAALFYRHLLTLDPALRPLFTGDMTAQGEKLMTMIGAALSLLDRPAQLLPVLHSLGGRHRGYGVRESHYDVVGRALLQTLHDGLADAFTDDARSAWIAIYGFIATEMMAGAAAQPPTVRMRQALSA